MAESVMPSVIFCMVLIGTFAILCNIIPNDFFIPEYRRSMEPPNLYESPSIFWGNISDYDTANLTCPTIHEFYLEVYDIKVIAYWYDIGGYPNEISLCHEYIEWWIFIRRDDIKPVITKDYALMHLISNVSELSLSCNHHTFYVRIAFDSTKYGSFSQAWDSGELFFYIGVGYDTVVSTRSAWALITQILFFQMPNVHPVINGIIAIPLWICMVFIIFTLMSRVIPFISGG